MVQPNPSTRVEQVGRSGVYPASGPLPPGDALVRGQGELAHPEERLAIRDRHAWRSHDMMLGLGRAIFGGYFLFNGINHFRGREELVEYAKTKDVPLPNAAVLGSGSLILLGGLSLVAGVRPAIGASLISLFLRPLRQKCTSSGQ